MQKDLIRYTSAGSLRTRRQKMQMYLITIKHARYAFLIFSLTGSRDRVVSVSEQGQGELADLAPRPAFS